MEKKFKSNELVWAKIRGFPWWPAIVILKLKNNLTQKIKKGWQHFLRQQFRKEDTGLFHRRHKPRRITRFKNRKIRFKIR